MTRGRPAKPTTLKVLHGDRKDRINRNEPTPEGRAAVPTESLSDAAQRVWDRVAPDLIRKGVLTAWDEQAFTTYCQTVAHYQEAQRQLAEHGYTDRGAAGGIIKSPYWQIMRDAIGVMTTIGGRFGLTPADRTHLVVGEQKRDPSADFLTG